MNITIQYFTNFFHESTNKALIKNKSLTETQVISYASNAYSQEKKTNNTKVEDLISNNWVRKAKRYHENFTVRRATKKEWKKYYDHANKIENWGYGKAIDGPIYTQWSNEIYVLEVDGKDVALIACMKSLDKAGKEYCFLNFLIVEKKANRGKGYGSYLLEFFFSKCGAGCKIGLDADSKLQGWYQKKGFQYDHCLLTYQNTAKAYKKIDLNMHKISVDDERLLTYDENVYGYKRRAFWKAMKKNDGIYHCVGWFDKEEVLKGFGCLRKSAEDTELYLISPVYADESKIAEDLIGKLQDFVAGYTVQIDIHCSNCEAMRMIDEDGWKLHVHSVRMYKGDALLATDFSRIFARIDEIS